MYSIKKVSESLGIPAVTIRAWEQRYDVVRPARSKGGHRMYSEEDLDTLRWIKDQLTEKNMKIGEAVFLLKKRKTDKEDYEKSQMAEITGTLYNHLVNLNTLQSHQTIDLAFSLYHYNDVFHHILTPVMYRIGDEWEEGLISTAQEHFSSQLLMQRCSQFLWTLPVHPGMPRALALCPEGELHQMGLVLFSLFLRNKGMDVAYLGPNTPLCDVEPLISAKNISLIAISATGTEPLEKLEAWFKQIREIFPAVEFVFGGKAFTGCETPLSPFTLPDTLPEWENWYRECRRLHA